MARGSLNLHVSKQDFVNRIGQIEGKMGQLNSVIERYNSARNNLDQFVEEGDSTYEAWIRRIDINVDACRKALASLQETKNKLQTTVDQMEGMYGQLTATVSDAADAAKSTIDATLKVASLL